MTEKPVFFDLTIKTAICVANKMVGIMMKCVQEINMCVCVCTSSWLWG